MVILLLLVCQSRCVDAELVTMFVVSMRIVQTHDIGCHPISPVALVASIWMLKVRMLGSVAICTFHCTNHQLCNRFDDVTTLKVRMLGSVAI
jgi:hypothetical protein